MGEQRQRAGCLSGCCHPRRWCTPRNPHVGLAGRVAGSNLRRAVEQLTLPLYLNWQRSRLLIGTFLVQVQVGVRKQHSPLSKREHTPGPGRGWLDVQVPAAGLQHLAPVVQLAERRTLNPRACRFESDLGYHDRPAMPMMVEQHGGVPEWPNGAALKAVTGEPVAGSNPAPSASSAPASRADTSLGTRSHRPTRREQVPTTSTIQHHPRSTRSTRMAL